LYIREINLSNIKIKKKGNVKTVLKFNRKIVETDGKSIPLTDKYMTTHPGFV
jgi:hypothetical protein